MRFDKQKVAFLLCVSKHDRLDYFQEALHSIYAQTYGKENIEIYLCIDGPISQELEAFIEQEKRNLVIVRNRKNEGLAAALNRLLELTKEEYLFRMDSDDISCPQRVEEQLRFLHDHPDVALAGSCVELIDENARSLGVRCFPEESESMKKKICFATPLAHPTVCFRKELFDSGIRYKEGLRYAQDLELWFRLLGCGVKMANVQKPLLRYRIHENVKNRNLRRLWYEFPIVFHGASLLDKRSECMIKFMMKVLLRVVPSSLKKIVYKKIWKKNGTGNCR